MMKRSNAFYSIAGQLADALDREQAIKEEIADLETILRANGGCTVQECRAVKRVLKAKAKGPDALQKLADKMDADSAIYDDLASKNLAYKKVVEIEHDPDTGEIHEIPPAAIVAGERGASVTRQDEVLPQADTCVDAESGAVTPVSVANPGDPSHSFDDNPCPPIPESMRRAV